jgi:Uma2 family endonuclease
MAVSVEKRLLTVEEYHEMGRVGILGPSDRVELIHGEIIKMSPIGSKHANTVNKLNTVLKDLCQERVVLSVQNPVVLNELNEPQPDISVLRHRDDFYGDSHPHAADVFFVVEVSDSTIEFDRQTKGALYASASIPEYWIIDLDRDRIELYSNPENDLYRETSLFTKDDKITSQFLKDAVAVADLLL